MTAKSRKPRTDPDPLYYEALGRAIKVVRISQGMSRKELAESTDISYPYVSEIETGKKKASSKALFQIAEALGMRPHELLEVAESMGTGSDGIISIASSTPADRPDWFGSRSIHMMKEAPLPFSALDHRVGSTQSSHEHKQAHEMRAELQAIIGSLEPDELASLLTLLRRLA